MPTGIYKRTKKHLEALKKRRIAPRTLEWNINIGNALRKGQNRICRCGKTFYAHKYRLKTAKYCSNECREKFKPTGLTKGMKILKGSLSKIGNKKSNVGQTSY